MPPEAAVPTSSALEAAEIAVRIGVQWLKLGVELVGALVILTGILAALRQVVRGARPEATHGYQRVRLTLARHLALALEFQLAADILSTAIAPTWSQIGQLAAIAVIRTALNYFLMREIHEVRGELGLAATEGALPAARGGEDTLRR